MRSKRWAVALYALVAVGPWLVATVLLAYGTVSETNDPELLCELAGDPPHMPESVYWYFALGVIQMGWIWLAIVGVLSVVFRLFRLVSLKAMAAVGGVLVGVLLLLELTRAVLEPEFHEAVWEHCLAGKLSLPADSQPGTFTQPAGELD